MTKQQVRLLAAKNRDKLFEMMTTERMSAIIQQRLLASPIFKQAKSIMCYSHIKSEVQTDLIIHYILNDNNGKVLFMPKLLGKTMLALRVDSLKQLTPGTFGILEPPSHALSCQSLDLCIVPMLAFSKERARIGYGKGYYDSFLEKHPETFKLGIAFSSQCYEFLAEAHDMPLDMIITEEVSI